MNRRKKLCYTMLGIILGYTEAHNDELITKEELDERINEEIQEIVSMIKDEIYK